MSYNHLFSEPLTRTSAYWLGFIAADGSIGRYPSARFSFSLKQSDADSVEALSRDLGIAGRAKHEPRFNRVTLQLSCKDLVEDLERLGLTPKKSRTIDHQIVPDVHQSHFIRGLFDGDGTVGLARPKKSRVLKRFFALYGHRPLLEHIEMSLSHMGHFSLWTRPSTGVTQLTSGALSTMQGVFDYLYGDRPTRCMLRKREGFIRALSYRSSEPGIPRDSEGRRLALIECGICGGHHWKRVDHLRRATRHFCSRQCAGVSLARKSA